MTPSKEALWNIAVHRPKIDPPLGTKLPFGV